MLLSVGTVYRATLAAGGGTQLAIKIVGRNGTRGRIPEDAESAASSAADGSSPAVERSAERARCAAMREGALLRELKGEPGILTLHAAFESAREVWLVVELAQTTLAAVAKASGGVPEATLRPWAIDVARGLCAVHRLGFVHLDVKPSNAVAAGRNPPGVRFGSLSCSGRHEKPVMPPPARAKG